MPSYIPFVNSETDCEHLRMFFSDSEVVRVGLDSLAAHRVEPDLLPPKAKLWIDSTVDGFCGDEARSRKRREDKSRENADSVQQRRPQWIPFIEGFSGNETLFKGSSIRAKDRRIVEKFVAEVLDACLDFKPAWISIPQFPQAVDARYNKINEYLVNATENWRRKRGFTGKLILPAIFTSVSQLSKKATRSSKIGRIVKSVQQLKVDGIWTVDKSLQDSKGSEIFIKQQFRSLVALQQELLLATRSVGRPAMIAGPYWAMNLVLWARGLIDHPAISLGSGYQYYLSGSIRNPPVARIMIRDLRQLVKAEPALGEWLEQALSEESIAKGAYNELNLLRTNLPTLLDSEAAKRQVNERYSEWLKMLEAVPADGRSVALYQDFSRAYVFGRSLEKFPWKGPDSNPGQVAKTFMLSCL